MGECRHRRHDAFHCTPSRSQTRTDLWTSVTIRLDQRRCNRDNRGSATTARAQGPSTSSSGTSSRRSTRPWLRGPMTSSSARSGPRGHLADERMLVAITAWPRPSIPHSCATTFTVRSSGHLGPQDQRGAFDDGGLRRIPDRAQRAGRVEGRRGVGPPPGRRHRSRGLSATEPGPRRTRLGRQLARRRQPRFTPTGI